MPKLILEKACSQYGAQMGRPNAKPDDVLKPVRLRMEYLPLVDGDYDRGGAYWGYTPGTRIYCAYGHDEDSGNRIRIFTRAKSRQEAKDNVREILPSATFYR